MKWIHSEVEKITERPTKEVEGAVWLGEREKERLWSELSWAMAKEVERILGFFKEKAREKERVMKDEQTSRVRGEKKIKIQNYSNGVNKQ